MNRLAVRLLIVAALAMGLFSGIESRVFYFPSREPFETPRGAEDVRFQTTDGLTLHGWFVRATDAAPAEQRPTVLHVHGNAGNLEGHIEFSRWLSGRGFHVFAFDYRGYGRSDLSRRGIVRADLLADSRAALGYLKRRPDVDPSRMAALGVSLGAVVGLALAADDQCVRCVVSVSAFSSWKGIAGDKLPVLGPLLVSGGMDATISAAAMGTRPLLLLHGELDTIIPPSHARLIEAASRRQSGATVRRILVPNTGHNDILIDDRAAQDTVVAFLQGALR